MVREEMQLKESKAMGVTAKANSDAWHEPNLYAWFETDSDAWFDPFYPKFYRSTGVNKIAFL